MHIDLFLLGVPLLLLFVRLLLAGVQLVALVLHFVQSLHLVLLLRTPQVQRVVLRLDARVEIVAVGVDDLGPGLAQLQVVQLGALEVLQVLEVELLRLVVLLEAVLEALGVLEDVLHHQRVALADVRVLLHELRLVLLGEVAVVTLVVELHELVAGLQLVVLLPAVEVAVGLDGVRVDVGGLGGGGRVVEGGGFEVGGDRGDGHDLAVGALD